MLKFTSRSDQALLLKSSKRQKFSFVKSSQITQRAKKLVQQCNLYYIDKKRVFCVESSGSKSRAYARIWGLPRLWQETLDVAPAYIIEVTHRFAKLPLQEQDRVLLHELAHIPKNFSGALVGHNGIDKRMREMIRIYEP